MSALSTLDLNRALLARQGLLAPLEGPVADVASRIGAIQAQSWPAVPVALWTRTPDLAPDAVTTALSRGELLYSTLLRGILHVVAADGYTAYAAVTEASGATEWRRRSEGPAPLMDRLREELRAYATGTPRSVDEVCAVVEAFLDRHPDATTAEEIAFQRQYRWRPFRTSPAFVRAPVDGAWGPKAPDALLAAPAADPDPDAALAAVVRRHLGAFGPATAEDIACWTGHRTTAVRARLDALDGELVTVTDEAGRVLHDLPDAPRPGADIPAPVRLLPAFDSVLLAHASRHRERILPPEFKDAVYVKANLQIRPTFLVDGMVAGTWAVEYKRRTATVVLRPLVALSRTVRTDLEAEAGRLTRFTHPAAIAHAVIVET